MSGSGTDYTQTPNLGLFKPIYDHDVEQWGDHLNANADVLDAAINTINTGGLFLPIAGGQMQGPLLTTATGGTVARAAQDRAAEVINVKDYGAKGDGTTDDTAAISAAIAVAATQRSVSYWNPQLTGAVYFPPGLYPTNGIDLPCGVSLIGAGQLQTTIFIRAGQNRSVIRVLEDPVSNPSPWLNRNHGCISGITVDGNAGAQTGTSHGIEVVDSSYPLSTRYGSSVDIHAINIISTLNCCLYVGHNRNYGMITNLRIAYAGSYGVQFSGCYDWYCQNIGIGNSKADGLNIYSCAGLSFDDLIIWSSIGAGLVLNQCGGYMFFSNMQIDSNGTYGIWYNPGTSATNSHMSITNAQLRNCSNTTNNAYPAIYTANIGGAGTSVLLGNIWFNWTATNATRPNYLIQTDATGFVQVNNLGYSTTAGTTAGSAPYATAAFNQPAQIIGLSGTTISGAAINGSTINGSTINNTVIGGTTPAAGTFTTLSTTGNSTIGGSLTSTGLPNLGASATTGAGYINIGLHTGYVASNVIYSSGWKYLGADYGWHFTSSTSQGGFQLFVGALGTAGGTYTPISAMWAKSDGSVLFNGGVGFNNVGPIGKPTINGACAGNTAIKALLTALANYGLVTDSTTA